MFSNLEHAIVVAAIIWGAVEVFRHVIPSFWERNESKSWKSTFDFDNRIKALEEKLGLKQEQK